MVNRAGPVLVLLFCAACGPDALPRFANPPEPDAQQAGDHEDDAGAQLTRAAPWHASA